MKEERNEAMNVTSITVYQELSGCDRCDVHTDLPDASYPLESKLTLKFKAAHGTGGYYCKTHFPGVPVQVLIEKG